MKKCFLRNVNIRTFHSPLSKSKLCLACYEDIENRDRINSKRNSVLMGFVKVREMVIYTNNSMMWVMFTACSLSCSLSPLYFHVQEREFLVAYSTIKYILTVYNLNAHPNSFFCIEHVEKNSYVSLLSSYITVPKRV